MLPPTFTRRNPVQPIGVAIKVSKQGVPTIYTEVGSIAPLSFLDWLVGKSVYTSLEDRGCFDTVLRVLPSEAIMQLGLTGVTSYHDLTISLMGRDGHLTVRRGNKWGSFSNVCKLVPESTPKAVRLAVELASLRMSNMGFENIDFKSVGRVIQDLVSQMCPFQPRAPDEHNEMFLSAFKGARMEGVTFGRSNVFDYDIRSAFPNVTADLVSTQGMEWVMSTDIVEEAFYAAVFCDVTVNEKLIRSPIAVRERERHLHFPVGEIKGVWLSKPDIDLLMQFPEFGTIDKIYKGSWGIAKSDARPYRRLMKRLFQARSSDPFLGPYIKLVMVALWGKFISIYTVLKDVNTGEGWSQASSLFNPVFAAHVTSEMRRRLFLQSIGSGVVGEFIDGFSSITPIVPGNSFGDFVMKGKGTMTLFNDSIKASSWNGNEGLLELAYMDRDKSSLTIPLVMQHTIASALATFPLEKAVLAIGRKVKGSQYISLGSSMRFLGNKPIRVGDLLDGQVVTYPPRDGEIKMFRFMKGIEISRQPFQLSEAVFIDE